MIRAIAVLMVCLAGRVPTDGRPWNGDPAAPEGLNPVEVMVNPPLHTYKQMKGTGYEAKDLHISEDDDATITDTEYRREQSQLIAKYLLYLGEVKGKRDESYIKNSLDIIKMLVTYSWLYNFRPDKNALRGVLPASIDENSPIKRIRSELEAELKARNVRTPVSDAILLYSNGMFQTIKEDLEANVKAYSKMTIDRKTLSNMDAKLAALTKRDNEIYEVLLDKNKFLLEIHKVAFKMAVQSYLLIFVPDVIDRRDKFVMKSYDGSQQKEFAIPPMSPENFERLVLEAEMENDAMKSDVPKSIEVYRKEQNEMITMYLKNLESIRRTSLSSFHDSNALSVIKLLLIYSWIHLLHPELKYLAEVYPVEEYSTVEGVQQNIIKELKKTITYPDIVNAIIRFNNHQHPEIRTILLSMVRDMFPMIDKNISTISMLSNGPLRNTEAMVRKENVIKLATLKMTTQFHEITKKLCVQSYVLVFLKSPYPNPVTLTSTEGEVLKVDLPPLDKDSYEDLAFFISDDKD